MEDFYYIFQRKSITQLFFGYGPPQFSYPLPLWGFSGIMKLVALYTSQVTHTCSQYWHPCYQRAKKVVSDSPGLVDFVIGQVNSVLNLPDRQVKIFQRIKITEVL